MSNITRTALDALSLTNFPDNTTQQISPADLRGWVESAVDSFVTQKDKSTFENAFYECKSSNITATSGTTNLTLATGNFVHITGPGISTIQVNSFGTLPAGSRFILNFEVPVELVYDSVQMILPGAANIIMAAGDSVMVVSEGGGNWRLIGYFPAAGLPVGTVTAVTASAPLSSSGGNAPDISITQASGSTDGYLSSGDWTTFNNKGNGTVTSITAGTGLNGGTITGSGTIDLANTTVTPASYTNANITVDAQGRITAASNGSGGGGGTPGGVDTQIQYNNGGAFGGVNDLTWDDVNNVLTANSPRIGQSVGNGHLHMHTINTSPPSGVTDYITLYADKSPKQIGARFETDGYTSAIEFGATADRTYTLPDASGNVVLDTTSQTLTNKTLGTPTIDGIATFGNGVSAGEIRLSEGSGGGSEYTAIKAAASIPTSGSYSLTLPVTQGGSGQVIVNDGTGQLSWANNGGSTTGQFLSTVAPATITGTTAETLLSELLIPANTFTDGNCFTMLFRARRQNTGTLVDRWNFYISNASGVFTGKPLIGFFTIPVNTQTGFSAERNITIYNSTTTYYVNSPASRYDDFNNDNLSSQSIDWTIPQYAIMTCIPVNTSQQIFNVSTHISPR